MHGPISKPKPKPKSGAKSEPKSEPASLIMLQFLAWVADRPRSYADTMEAWRSTCPRLSVWEDAIIEGFVRIENGAGRAVTLTPRGRAAIAAPAGAAVKGS
jgi:hypothetical protein